MKAPLFNPERLRTIWSLNCGKFDYYLSKYERNKVTINDLELAFRGINACNSKKALELLDKCSKAENAYPIAIVHYGRGCVYEDLRNDLAMAEREYEIALEGDWGVELVPCADRLARLKAHREELEVAISLWERAAKLDPENSSIRWNLATARRNVELKAGDGGSKAKTNDK